MKIPKDGILAKVFWRDVTFHTSYSEERGFKDMVLKCSVGILMPTNDNHVVRVLSEWDIDHNASDDSSDLILTKDAIEKIIPLTEKRNKCVKKKKK